MRITTDYEKIHVSDVREFNEPDVDDLVQDLREALQPAHATIEFDLAHLRSADSDTVDALLAVYEEFYLDGPARVWRMINPPPDLRQLLELMRLHHLFEITPPRPTRMILL